MFLLTISLNLKGNVEHFGTMVEDLLIEGLTVAAWVSLWAAFANLIFKLTRIISEIRIYRRIAGIHVIFKTSNFSRTLHAKKY